MSSSLTTFDSTKLSLTTLLSAINEGRIQLPDFQRGWVWDDDHIKSLLASISLSFPVGTIMILETGNDQVRFKPRPVEGAIFSNAIKPESLILDGQQRLTSLFQSLYSGNVVETRDARKKIIRRWYYIDIQKALDPYADREEAIVSLPENRLIMNFRSEILENYSSPEKEYEMGLFPMSQVFHSSDWRTAYSEFWEYDREKIKLFNDFEREVIKRFEQYLVPVINLYKETPKEAVCQVFEKVNTGGVSLTVFELLTATFAADNFDLREDWLIRDKRLRQNKILNNLQNDDFLQAIALLITYARRKNSLKSGVTVENAPGISCKRKDILAMQRDEYETWADRVTYGFEKAARLLYSQKIYASRDLPYRTQLVPLASVYALLGDLADRDSVRAKLVIWYWCGVFGELYSSAVETRFAKDLPEILEWIDQGDNYQPTTVKDANFAPNRLLTLTTRNSAAYKGLSAILLRDGGQDFITGEPIEAQMYADEQIDIHHIFPRDWCDRHGIERQWRDSIVNKTPLSARTNRKISNNAPDVYLARIEKDSGISPQRMNEILESHVIDSTTMRSIDFGTFFQRRASALLERIQSAMGKEIAQNISDDYDSPDQFDFDEDEIQPLMA